MSEDANAYQNVAAGTATTTAVGAIEFGAYFRNGLTLVSATGTGADYTVVYQ